MKKPLIVLWIIFAVCMTEALSQTLVWERSFPSTGIDELNDIIGLGDGNYFAAGRRRSYGFNAPRATYWGLALTKINARGDSIFCKHLGGYYVSWPPRMCQGDSGEIYLVFKMGFTSDLVRVLKLDYEGNILYEFAISSTENYTMDKILFTKRKDLLIAGTTSPPSGSFRDSMVVIKANASGVILWKNIYGGGGTYTSGEYMERTPDNTFLASGCTSANIWAMEVDSNGNELRRGNLYRNTPNQLFFQASVQSAPNNRFVAAGNIGTRGRFYLGSHNAIIGGRQWGREQTGRIVLPRVNDDGSIVAYIAFGARRVLQKIAPDSTIIWERSLNSALGSDDLEIQAISYLSDSSAILAGAISFNTLNYTDFYICRISGVGVPYDPTTPVGTRPQLGSKGGVSLWPQPSGGVVHFGGFVGPATMVLYDMKGQRVLLPTAVLPRQPLSIAHLPKGLYLYRLVAKDRVWTGKVVRE